jgi:glycosyltransferase involved in cell wall biosynthesis
MIRGGISPKEVKAEVERFGATVVHAHNVHPTFGWRALQAAREAGAATVVHLHNYRLYCAIGTVYRDGADCTECAPNKTLNGIKHNCRGSIPEAAIYAYGLRRHQQRMIDAVDRFIAPVRQLGENLEAELERDLPVTVAPYWLPESEFVNASRAGDGEYALFVGRVTRDMGVMTAIAASADSEVPLVIAGEGPDLPQARSLAAKLNAPVEFVGRIDGQALVAARMGAAFALLPSLWREVLPFSGLEALAAGHPLLTSDRGGLPEQTEPQFVTPAGDADALAQTMRQLYDDPAERTAAGERALSRARERFSEEAAAPRLAEIYREAIKSHRQR